MTYDPGIFFFVGYCAGIVMGKIAGCRHKWTIVSQTQLRDPNSIYFAERFILQCEKCGNVKAKRL